MNHANLAPHLSRQLKGMGLILHRVSDINQMGYTFPKHQQNINTHFQHYLVFKDQINFHFLQKILGIR